MDKEIKKNSVALVIQSSTIIGGAERRLIRIYSKIEGVDILVNALEPADKVKATLIKYSNNMEDTISCYENMNDIIKIIWNNKYKYIAYINSSGSMLLIPIIAALTKTKRLWLLVNINMSAWQVNNLKDRFIFYIFKCFASRVDCLYPSKVEKLQQKMGRNVKVSSTPVPFTDKKLFLPKQKENYIVFASRLIEEKGVIEFIESVILCKEEIRRFNYRCLICGEGKFKKELIKRIQDNSISDIASIMGYCEMEKIFPNAKIFMSLQEKENYPSQSLIEAITCGCWCIATDVGETRKLVKQEFGRTIKGEVNEISRAMIQAMKMTNKDYEKIKFEARKFAENNFDIQLSIDHFTNIFSE